MTSRVLLSDPGYIARLCTYAPGYAMSAHAHDTTAMSLVLSGAVQERCNRTDVAASTLSVVVKPSGVLHANRFGPGGARMLAIEFAPSFLDDLDVRAEGFGRWRWGHGGPLATPALRLWQTFAQQEKSSDPPDDLLVALVDLLHNAPSRTGALPTWLRNVRDRLHDEFAAPPTAQSLAAAAGVHRVHLARQFRQHFGCSTTDYLRRVRVRAAAHAIASTEAPLVVVAADVGFADQSHLTRAFKTETGVTPGAFRDLVRA